LPRTAPRPALRDFGGSADARVRSRTRAAGLLVVAYAAHGLEDLWQHRTHFLANTRWWPPYCCAVDMLVALVLVVMIAAGVDFH
jgi:hypothetical protein